MKNEPEPTIEELAKQDPREFLKDEEPRGDAPKEREADWPPPDEELPF
jgi:hypothetical protein